MYQDDFQLRRQPLGPCAEVDDIYVGPRQAKVLANAKIALTTPDAIVTITGPYGVGKSTLTSRAISMLKARTATARVGRLRLASVDELLELLVAEFGIQSEANTRIGRLQDLRCFFSEQHQEGRRAAILVEDAFALGVAGLQALEAATCADPAGCPGANVIVMADGTLEPLMKAPELGPLWQRTRAKQIINPLNEEETEAYLRHRITVVGGTYEDIFAPKAATAVYQATGGMPRLIDNVSDSAISLAHSKGLGATPPSLIQKTAVSLYGLNPGDLIEDEVALQSPQPIEEPVAEPESSPGAELAEVSESPEADTDVGVETIVDEEPEDVLGSTTSNRLEAASAEAGLQASEAPAADDDIEPRGDESASSEESAPLPTTEPAAESDPIAPTVDEPIAQTSAVEPAVDAHAPSFESPTDPPADLQIPTAESAESAAVAEPPPPEPSAPELTASDPVKGEESAASEFVIQPPAADAASASEPVFRLPNQDVVDTPESEHREVVEIAPAPAEPEAAQSTVEPPLSLGADDDPALALALEPEASASPGAPVGGPEPVDLVVEVPELTDEASVPEPPTVEQSAVLPILEDEFPLADDATGYGPAPNLSEPSEQDLHAAASASFEEWAASVSEANTLEDIDEKLAETLFAASELEAITAEINSDRQVAEPSVDGDGDPKAAEG